MIKKTPKTASRKTPEMARQGAQNFIEGIGTSGRRLKRSTGLLFGVFPDNNELSAISEVIKKVHTFGAKRPFKGWLKGGLKKIIKTGPKSLTLFSHFRQKRRFYHVQMV